MAWWQSGYAEDCKSLYAGSIPTQASRFLKEKHRLLPVFFTLRPNTPDHKKVFVYIPLYADFLLLITILILTLIFPFVF